MLCEPPRDVKVDRVGETRAVGRRELDAREPKKDHEDRKRDQRDDSPRDPRRDTRARRDRSWQCRGDRLDEIGHPSTVTIGA